MCKTCPFAWIYVCIEVCVVSACGVHVCVCVRISSVCLRVEFFLSGFLCERRSGSLERWGETGKKSEKPSCKTTTCENVKAAYTVTNSKAATGLLLWNFVGAAEKAGLLASRRTNLRRNQSDPERVAWKLVFRSTQPLLERRHMLHTERRIMLFQIPEGFKRDGSIHLGTTCRIDPQLRCP